MKKLFFYSLNIFIFLFAISSCDSKKTQGSESDFAQAVAVSDTTTINNENPAETDKMEDMVILSMMNSRLQFELGRLAQDRVSSANARTLTNLILNNSTKVQEKITSIAQASNVVIPPALTPEYQSHLQKMRDLEISDFEKEFGVIIAQETEEDIKRYENILTSASNPLLRGLASETLDLLRPQLELARKISN